MHFESREVVEIPQRLEDAALELVREIDLAFDAVVEAKPQDMVTPSSA